jgi:hypothetical protein
VFHRDFSGVLNLPIGPAQRSRQSTRSHRTGYAHFALATDLRATDRSVLLI